MISIIGKGLDGNTEIKKIDYLYSSQYHMNLVYVCCDQGKYVIPYAEDLSVINAYADDVKIQNGKLYKVKDFMKIMNLLFDEVRLKNMGAEVSTGGLMYRQGHSWAGIAIMGGSMLFLIVMGVIAHKKRKV